MNCSEIQPQLEAYALNALDPLSRPRVENHLETCAACRRTLSSFQAVLGELPHALSRASALYPPASLKSKIMQAAQADASAHQDPQPIELARVTARASIAQPPIRNSRRGHWLLNPRFWMISLGGSLALILVMLSWFTITTLQMQQELARQEVSLQQMDAASKRKEEGLVYVLTHPKYQTIVLSPTDPSIQTEATIRITRDDPTILFTAKNLPPLPTGKRYILWTTTNGVTQQVAQFEPDSHQGISVVFFADRDFPLLKQVFVTRQPAKYPYPSRDRILDWRADQRDGTDSINSDWIYPPQPTAAP